jgi:hypothetical protein
VITEVTFGGNAEDVLKMFCRQGMASCARLKTGDNVGVVAIDDDPLSLRG